MGEIIKLSDRVEQLAEVMELGTSREEMSGYNLLSKIAESSLKSMSHRDNDFEDKGMLYCGVCGQEKWAFIKYKGYPDIKRWKQCKCDEEEFAREESEKAEEEKKKRIEENTLKSGMLRSFTSASFDDWRITKENAYIKKVCEKYVSNFKEVMMKNNQGLLMWGDTGIGKTWASACIGKKLLKEGFSVRMTSSISIVQGDEDITRASLLIIDDFGAERGTEYAVERICKAIDDRYNCKKPFIITTNNSLNQMKNEIDIKYKRMYERILECCYPIQFCGESMRIESARDRFREMERFFKD